MSSSSAAVHDSNLNRITDETVALITSRTIWHGLTAITQHGLDYTVPAPSSVSIDNDAIRVHVRAHARQAWVESIHVDRHESSPSTASWGRRVHTAYGRLPDSGVRVEVISLHEVGDEVDEYVGEARA